jgi:hypothetical protein
LAAAIASAALVRTDVSLWTGTPFLSHSIPNIAVSSFYQGAKRDAGRRDQARDAVEAYTKASCRKRAQQFMLTRDQSFVG